jgi:hypothetical protein
MRPLFAPPYKKTEGLSSPLPAKAGRAPPAGPKMPMSYCAGVELLKLLTCWAIPVLRGQ